MNNRIRELESQCWETLQLTSDANSWHTSFNSQKFAELIVKECVSTLNDMHMWQSVNNQNYPNLWHDAVDQGINAIKEHFGVLE